MDEQTTRISSTGARFGTLPRRLLLAWAVVGLSACAGVPAGLGVLRNFPHVFTSGEQPARLVFDGPRYAGGGGGWAEWVELRAVDGKPFDAGEHGPYEVALDGRRVYRLTLRYSYEAGTARDPQDRQLGHGVVEQITQRFEAEVPILAEPGRRYLVRYRVERASMAAPVSQWHLRYWIEDADTGERVTAEVPPPGHLRGT